MFKVTTRTHSEYRGDSVREKWTFHFYEEGGVSEVELESLAENERGYYTEDMRDTTVDLENVPTEAREAVSEILLRNAEEV